MIENQRHSQEQGDYENVEDNDNLPAMEAFNASSANSMAEYKGDKQNYKTQGTFRVGFININGLPPTNDDDKNKDILESINKCNFDFIGLAEVNRNWYNISLEHKWFNRVSTWWESSKHVLSYNKNDCCEDIFQPGGTVSITLGDNVHRIIATGSDDILGRWSWTTIRGGNDIHTTIITAYRPCLRGGEKTTYTQHIRTFNLQQRKGCPRHLWKVDLQQFIQQRMDKGEQIILAADMNENIRNSRIRNWISQMGLIEGITLQHKEEVPTVNIGSKTIDGIFTSPSLTIIKAGYLAFGEFPSNHRCLWIDFNTDSVLGFKPPKMFKPQARRLQCSLPKVKKKWQQEYLTKLRQNNLLKRQFRLESTITGSLTKEQSQEFEAIMELRQKCISFADHKCTRLKMGNVEFSPDIAIARKEIEVWRAVITRKTGELIHEITKNIKSENSEKYISIYSCVKHDEKV